MTILESNDHELRKLIFNKPKVVVKFTDEDYPVCKTMSLTFRNTSGQAAYKAITFVRMSAQENPVCSKELKMTGTPFFAMYKASKLIDCGIAATEQELRAMLQKLL